MSKCFNFLIVLIFDSFLFAFTPTSHYPAVPLKNKFSSSDTSDSALSAAAATKALASFNHYFYASKDKLFYSNANKTTIGAIWTQAIFWDIVMNAYQQTGNKNYLKQLKDIYTGGDNKYDHYNWNNKKVWFIYDDMMWWVISLSNGYTITKNATYLQHAEKGFAHIWECSYDKKNGGMFWDFNHSGKNSCINFPTVIAAMKLFNITNDSIYFEKAKNVYEWGRKNLTDTLSGRVADNKIGNHPAGFTDYTYNTGTFIGAAVLLFKATKDSAYLKDAIKSSDYTKNSMCKNGVLPAEGDWNEQGVMKSIFAQYISKLIFDCGQTQYLDWIRHNISAAWSHRDANRTLMYRDYSVTCPTGNIQSYEASSGVAFMQLFNR